LQIAQRGFVGQQIGKTVGEGEGTASWRLPAATGGPASS
jgi:hypothetical protein